MTTENKEQLTLKEINKEENCGVPSTSDEISLVDLILILWRGKWLVVGCTVLATIVGFINAIRATEVFTTSTIFITKTGSKNNGGLGQLAALAGINVGNNANVDPTAFLEKVLENKDYINNLYMHKWFFRGDSCYLDSIFKIKPDTTESNWEYSHSVRKLDAIRKSNIITLVADSKTGLQTLSCNAPDPQLAYDLNVFTLDYLSNYIRNSLKSQVKEKRMFIEERISEVQKMLETSEDSLAQYRARNLSTRSPQILLEESRLTRDVAMNQEVYIQLKKQYEMARIEELDDLALVQVISEAEVPLFRSKPKRDVIVLIALSSGFLAGIFLTFVLNTFIKLLKTMRKDNV